MTTLGCRYTPASSGYQGGSDGTGVFTLGGRDYRWKFECKSTLTEYQNRIGKTPLDNLMEILASDKSTWPQVFCLFSPHKRKDSQIENKCRTLEGNGIVPFKICLWNFDYLSSRIGHLIPEESMDRLFPSVQLQRLNAREDVMRTLLDEVSEKSVQGKLIANSYFAVKYQELVAKKIEIAVAKKTTYTGESYELKYGSIVHFLPIEDLERCRLTVIPKKWVSLSQKSTINSTSLSDSTPMGQPASRAIEAIDIDEYNRQIGTRKVQFLDLFEKIKFNDSSLSQILKKHKKKHPMLTFRLEKNAQDFHDIPTRFIDESDLGISTTFTVRLANA